MFKINVRPGSVKPVLRVLESVPPPTSTIQFVDQVVQHAPPDIDFIYFSYRAALLKKYDVLHVHWPEWLVRHHTAAGTLVRRFLFRLLLCRLSHQRIPVVRTVHNIEPHESGNVSESRVLARFEALTENRVILNDCTPTNQSGRTTLIPHGDYREPFQHLARSPRIPGRVLFFGKIKPYKGVIELLDAAEDVSLPYAHLRIVGYPTEEMRENIINSLAKPNRCGAKVSVDLRILSDEELAHEISASDLVVLPYRDAGNGNSGAAILALSLDRPILVPHSCIMDRLAEEVGDEWVHKFDPDISGPDIESALFAVRKLPKDDSPRFIGREWPAIAALYADTFRVATQTRRTSKQLRFSKSHIASGGHNDEGEATM
ncbi:GDP-mannose:glycolipid 4-beta-D-mannosyltransferase precursor [Mycobacterium sp. THAF192]|nr:GDP-mannose:glycolipid 4-beta-D-mannosyltransferase precursor [Mycobacterium sp. THAF192]